MGLIATKFKRLTSRLTTLTIVDENDEIMIASANGVVTRQKVDNISRQSRSATGVKVQNMMDDDTIVAVNKISSSSEEEIDE